MSFNRAEVIDKQFTDFLRCLPPSAERGAAPDAAVRNGTDLAGCALLDLFDSQLTCRHLDLIARVLRGRDAGYYTIGSAGHEGNAVLGLLVRHTDPSFLHYRS